MKKGYSCHAKGTLYPNAETFFLNEGTFFPNDGTFFLDEGTFSQSIM